MTLNRKSEAYDDPLRKRSTTFTTSKGTLMGKAKQDKIERFVTVQEDQIEWSNLIFLPFHPVFRQFVLFSVFIKAVLGPIQSVYPIVYCDDTMDYHPALIFLKYTYWYICDSIYGIDTFLHIVHRQVVDKAMRREHLPKSAILLTCDLISLIPFFRLVVSTSCPPTRVWPNILGFNEFLIIYRVTQYFSLVTTHSYTKIVIGYACLLAMCINCITCFWLLLTHEGFCERCTDPTKLFDWRAYIIHKLNETTPAFTTFVYGAVFVYSFVIRQPIDEVKPSSILEYTMVCLFMIAGYILYHFLIVPKCFAESMLRFRKICSRYPVVKKVIEETKRRNPTDNPDKVVENYYKLIWRKRNCIVKLPEFFTDLPRYLKLEIHQDLLWPLYYHSPTLRMTSYPFRRWLGEYTEIDFKLPGEKFFFGNSSNSTLYYLKSGIVQLTSIDDGATPILSVTSGTVFGDISFIIPHRKRKVLVRCLTYCEMFYIDRKQMLIALHKYPQDKKLIMESVKTRLDHAKILFTNKELIRGLDRNEDEGIAWIKRRWWEISNYIHEYTQITGKSIEMMKHSSTLPQEETIYHCPKYIGQLVLCNHTQLQTKSMFTHTKFPWILNRYSRFGYEWHRIVYITVVLVLLIYPQNLVKEQVPSWFTFFSLCTDTIYILDIGVSLFTAMQVQDSVTLNFSTVLFERFKTLTFLLDLISTVWIEDLAELAGSKKFHQTLQFNRLIKIYVLFYGDYLAWDIRKDPMVEVCRIIVLIQMSNLLLASNIVFDMLYYWDLNMEYFFGEKLCQEEETQNCEPVDRFVGVVISWAFEAAYSEYGSSSLADTYVTITETFISHIIYIYCRGTMISYLYLKNRTMIKYQSFVKNLNKYYEHYSIHQDLLNRLDRYLVCHWKYYKGTDILYSNSLENEAYAIYWKAQGSVAEEIMNTSPALKNCDPALLKELASAAKFLLLPRNQALFMFGIACKNVIWIIQGYVKSEYHDENGDIVTAFFERGNGLALTSIFLERVALRTYTTYTECEVLYIPVKDFLQIYKKYPQEYSYIETCVREFGPQFDEMFKKYVLKHKDHQTKLRDRIYSTRMSMVTTTKVLGDMQDYRSLPVEGVFWAEPESRFIQSWMLFRVVVVCISIISASMLGGVGAVFRWIFMMVSAFCDGVAWIDIGIKLCLPYYKTNGLLITDKKKCLINYLTKGFLLDLIGTVPWFSVLKALLSHNIDDDATFLINTFCKFAHIYILFAYCDYISDTPIVNRTIVMIVKWQIVNILIVMACSHYLMINCVHFKFNVKTMRLTDVTYRNTSCWMPNIYTFPEKLTGAELHLIFAQSLSFAESGMMRTNFGRFKVDRRHLGVGLILYSLGLVFWCISCYTLVLLVLNGRGDTTYQHGVNQLTKFLKSERVEKEVVHKCMDHFTYCWVRTKGINIAQVTNERIGVVFRQDLSYYFYKKTFTILGTILGMGEAMQRHLASVSDLAYFLPEHDIFREMDLMSHVCIVHRGRVNIFKNDKKIIVLTKGDIFGQLKANKGKTIHVTATAEDHVDVLYIRVEAFQNIINKQVRRVISVSKQAKNHFMATKHVFVENPYDTVQYLLRGRKTIMLPWNKTPSEAKPGSWYSRWLYLVWLINPYLATTIVVFFAILPEESVFWTRCYIMVFFTDVVTLANFIAEFYTIELTVEKRNCAYKRIGLQRFKHWGVYMELLSMLIPLITLITKQWQYQLGRLCRLKVLIDFEFHFCRDFQSRISPNILKVVITVLLIHLFTCGWILFACREPEFPIPIPSTHDQVDYIDFTQWSPPDQRIGGCARTTKRIDDGHGNKVPSFVVPMSTPHDYIVAVTYILLIHTHTNLDCILAVSLKQVYYKVFVTFFMYLLDMWIMAVAINYAFTKYRELYQYDYGVLNMVSYLTANGICRSLKETVIEYTEQVWKRERGDWLPELAYGAPTCLREDIFTSLYIHHLNRLGTFQDVPFYFKRQLVARFRRVVIFPGKCIVREGDTFNTTYFIHQGEVEKWFTDPSGEGQLLSVLNTNGYFGSISGLFPNASFKFSYYTRTVVDLVYLKLKHWQDLLDLYPDIAAIIYEATNQFKESLTKAQYGKSTGSMSSNVV